MMGCIANGLTVRDTAERGKTIYIEWSHSVEVQLNISQCDNYEKIMLAYDKRQDIDGLVHERHNSSALAMKLRLSCTITWIEILIVV